MVLLNIAAVIVIVSSIYDIYVNYNVKKQNDSLEEVTEGMKRELEEMKKTSEVSISIDGKELIKAINEEHKKHKNIKLVP
ncbi:hypothetical protein [Clostridium intestinale]|uniref:Uncharacterized protein n=1 Tax=Clostridium intestinale TaxID=36845 RepID=A0A7D6VMC9_9CLOT|nr:hypothetical protein [Clostridium intestinale]QLY78047.1 hypothetical protein HZF06_13185 [Clostridium intestinale]